MLIRQFFFKINFFQRLIIVDLHSISEGALLQCKNGLFCEKIKNKKNVSSTI
jgi:hypothetical protein